MEIRYGDYLVQVTKESLNEKGELSPEVICTACRGIVCIPVQTLCGHRYCKVCLEKIIEGEKKCKAEDCLEENVELEFDESKGTQIYFYPDGFIKKTVGKIRALCPNHAKGCDWTGGLDGVQAHIDGECKFRTEKCSYCLELISTAEIPAHHLICSKVVRPCVLAEQGCPVKEQMTTQELTRHNLQYATLHLNLMAQFLTDRPSPGLVTSPSGGIPSESDGSKELKTAESQQKPPMKHASLSNEMHVDVDIASTIRRLDSQNRLLEEKVTEKDKQILQLEKKLSNLTDAVEKMEKKQEDHAFRLMLEESSTHVGETIWRIPNFRQRQEDAKKNKFSSIYSLPFYTSRYGYKMCLRLYPFGDGSGRATHLSLFLVVMKGEYDDILEWPYRHKVSFQLLNAKQTKEDITDAFRADPASSSFQKPVSDMNVATGCPKFAPLSALYSEGFVANDTIYIRAKVDSFSGSKLGPSRGTVSV